MKRLVALFILFSFSFLFSTSTFADVITGNLGACQTGWNSTDPALCDAEDGNGRGYPAVQGITISDPGIGKRWQIDSLTLEAVARDWWFADYAPTHGLQAWLISTDLLTPPQLPFHNTQFIDNRPLAVAYFRYDPFPSDPNIVLPDGDWECNGDFLADLQIPISVDNIAECPLDSGDLCGSQPQLIGGGTYYLVIYPLDRDVLPPGTQAGLAIGRDNSTNSYDGGWQGYFQWQLDSFGANDGGGTRPNHDLCFQLDGTLVDFAEVLIDESDGSTLVSEHGTTDSFTIRLASLPTDQVTIRVTADNQSLVTDGIVAPTNEIFLNFAAVSGPGGYDDPQTVTVSAIDDLVNEVTTWPPDTHPSTLTLTPFSSDLDYHNVSQGGNMTIDPVAVEIQDNDFPCDTPGLEHLSGDLNLDCRVHYPDVAVLNADWNQSNEPNGPPADPPATPLDVDNMNGWDGTSRVEYALGLLPLVQGITLPDPGAGKLWQIDSLSFAAVAKDWPGSGSPTTVTGFSAWLIPAPLPANGDAYSTSFDDRATAVASFQYHHGGPFPVPNDPNFPTNTVSVTAVNNQCSLVPAGTYRLEIHRMPLDGTAANYMAIGTGGDNYPGGAGGGAGISGGIKWLIDTNVDLAFALDGIAVDAPAAAEAVTIDNQAYFLANGFEEFPGGKFPIFQNITLPNPVTPGALWKIDTLCFPAVVGNWEDLGSRSTTVSTGFQAWLRPGTLAHNDPYDEHQNDAVAYAKKIVSSPLPTGITNAIPMSVEFDYSGFVPGGQYYLELRPLAEDIVAEEDVSYLGFGHDDNKSSYPGGTEGFFQFGDSTVGINALRDLTFRLEGAAQTTPTAPTVSIPNSNPTRTQVLVGNTIDFTPAVDEYEVAWDMNNGAWAPDSSVHREFDSEVYTYNDNYVTQNGALTPAWIESDATGVGGIVWHFQTTNQNVATMGGMQVDISAVNSFAKVTNSVGPLQPTEHFIEIYYSDENSFANLSPMTGGVWGDGSTLEDPNGNWQLLHSSRAGSDVGHYNFFKADPNTVISADGDFWVRVDIGSYNEQLFNDRPAFNALGAAQLNVLQVKGRYNWPQTCAENFIFGQGLPADVDQDCFVGILDLSGVVETWLECNDPQDAQCISFY